MRVGSHRLLPDRLVQLLRADAAVRVPRQIQQRRKFLLRQVQVGLSDVRASAQQIHLQRAKPYCAFLRVRRTQTRFHAGHEHLQIIRLCQIIVSACGQTLDDILIFSHSGQEQDRHIVFLLDLAAQRHAVAVRQKNIQHDQVHRVKAQQLPALVCSFRLQGAVTAHVQCRVVDRHDVRVVLHQQNQFIFHNRSLLVF